MTAQTKQTRKGGAVGVKVTSNGKEDKSCLDIVRCFAMSLVSTDDDSIAWVQDRKTECRILLLVLQPETSVHEFFIRDVPPGVCRHFSANRFRLNFSLDSFSIPLTFPV